MGNQDRNRSLAVRPALTSQLACSALSRAVSQTQPCASSTSASIPSPSPGRTVSFAFPPYYPSPDEEGLLAHLDHRQCGPASFPAPAQTGSRRRCRRPEQSHGSPRPSPLRPARSAARVSGGLSFVCPSGLCVRTGLAAAKGRSVDWWARGSGHTNVGTRIRGRIEAGRARTRLACFSA